MPPDVVAGLLSDPCFQIAIDNHVPGRGGTVWMACPVDISWKGSRSVVSEGAQNRPSGAP
jgi:hypothetical protein